MPANPLPIVLIPGLSCSSRLFELQLPALWQCGTVIVADHRRDDSMAAIARRILDAAPPRFALVGLSMGGYIAFEILRQAAARVASLALLATSARPETPQQSERRNAQIALAREGRFADIPPQMYALLSRRAQRGDAAMIGIIDAMAQDTGADAFIRQQTAIMHRADSRPTLRAIRCPAWVIVGDEDRLTPAALAQEMTQGISGARLEVVRDCGHLCTLDQAESLTRLLREWLQQTAS